MDHQQAAQRRARRADADRRSAAGRHRLSRRPDRRCGGACRRGAPAHRCHRPARCAEVRDAGGGAGCRHVGGAARHIAGAVAAARATRPARQRHDSRQGIDAGIDAVRGFRVLRQADARATRGIKPSIEPGDAHIRSAAERNIAALLRRAADQVLAMGGCAARSCGTTRIPRRGQIFGRGISHVPLARPGIAHADLSGIGAGTRRSRQGGQTVPARGPAAGPLSRDIHPPVPRGS